MKNFALVLIVAAVVASAQPPLFATAAPPPPVHAAARVQPDVAILAREAAAIVSGRLKVTGVKFFAAGGTTANGQKTSSAAGITEWSFLFNIDQSQGSSYGSARIDYIKGKFKAVVTNAYPYVGGDTMTPIPAMRFARAVQLLRAAGHHDRILLVELRFPLYPGVTEPEYMFNFGGAKPEITVGTKTGKVKVIK